MLNALRACLTAFLADTMCASSASTGSTFTCGVWPSIWAACKHCKVNERASSFLIAQPRHNIQHSIYANWSKIQAASLHGPWCYLQCTSRQLWTLQHAAAAVAHKEHLLRLTEACLVHVDSQDSGLGTPSRYLARTLSWNACKLLFLLLLLLSNMPDIRQYK